MATTAKFRTAFEYNLKNFKAWYPGHMNIALKTMQDNLRNTDCILEVHDARIPFTGRNPHFYTTLKIARPHILLLNKYDLAGYRFRSEPIFSKIKMEGFSDVLFTNCNDPHNAGVKKIMPTILKAIRSSPMYQKKMNQEYEVMVIGIPNTGKSTVINLLRTMNVGVGNAASVGAIPGITRKVSQKIKISEKPLIYLVDTPGVIDPKVKDVDEAFRTALVGSTKDSVVGIQNLVDYMLYWMNKHECFKYVEVLEMPEPVDDVGKLLLHTALLIKKEKRVNTSGQDTRLQPDFEAAAEYVLKCFRSGKFGMVNLDMDKSSVRGFQRPTGQIYE